METQTGLSLSMTFTAFMVMLGPVKIVAPFAALTNAMAEAEARRLASKAIGFAFIVGVVAAVVGVNTLGSWAISSQVLHFSAGVILLLVALRGVLSQYEPVGDAATSTAAPRNAALNPLAFPTIVTPHGIAILILLLVINPDHAKDVAIVALFAVMMLINWIVMWFARPIMRRGGTGLAILGAVLGVLQVSLALKMLFDALRSMHLLPVS
ncbi:MAG TPA: MarC family protein [Povalibacter sp.]|uniref:MarC family protein n=1 Tax=Povalibacter sp. TaxID=1962978 RepID=UPI002B827E90|nr:MarC family protein [Povalibacter sp.]HMN45873.1 MarC family protein [Povalibacter sp.]